jgi:hypothetical protein
MEKKAKKIKTLTPITSKFFKIIKNNKYKGRWWFKKRSNTRLHNRTLKNLRLIKNIIDVKTMLFNLASRSQIS